MNTLKMKITGWDEDSKSILVRYASDETANTNPDAYYNLAFQPHLMFPEANTAVEIKTALAKAGVSVVQEIKINEDLADDTDKLNMLRGLVSSSVLSYAASELIEDTDGSVEPVSVVSTPMEEV
jgi:hypothetical protein